ncbi:NiFe-hydrogenase/NADH-quinone oxidoreductase [Nitrosotalea devaniterrae]|uniref:NiFe-hydrogenase/NADH-quinone oxidoreductase n=1 Tax=Nitrosotalea devaniterrae TaxID=1078905 RepID=A0A128A2R7_9ARCH|nr:NiFe-hydrogenase/NADH-quinone oxidoreductase [Candidatus Nitrosotalea devanaterra]
MMEKSRKILGNHVETRSLDDLIIADDYRGKMAFISKIANDHQDLENVCPTRAISKKDDCTMTLDSGKCIMCGYCAESFPKLVKIENKCANPAKTKNQLIEYSASLEHLPDKSYEKMGVELQEKIKKLFGRSLAIREIDAGSCNGCEIEITALNNPIYDIERFGIHFVSSPRHADVLLVTGPASRNMETALLRTYEATPTPKIVIAVGACACSGGIFGDTYATTGGIDTIVPVDVYIPGCPPRPEILIRGLLLAVDRMATHGS